MVRLELVPFQWAAWSCLLARAQVCVLLLLPLGRGEVPRPPPPGGRAQGPTERGSPCSIMFLWIPFEGGKCKQCTEKVGAC